MKENNIIAICLLCIMAFSFVGWYFAEVDNQILREELALYVGKEIRK